MKIFSLLYLNGSSLDFFKVLKHEIIHADSVVCARDQFENICRSQIADFDLSRVYISVVQAVLKGA